MPERIAPPVGSHAHQRLLELIRSRRALSTKALSEHYPKWRKADRLYKHYVDPSETDPAGKRLYPYARSIVVPLTFAIVQTQLAWEMAAFTGRLPIVPLGGVSPEDTKPAKVMEQVLQYEWNQSGSGPAQLALYQWLLDRRRYGVGVLWVNWVREATRQWVETPRRLDIPLLGLSVDAGTVGAWQDRVKYEGNRLEPIDPFYFYPDPRVPIGQCQRGEYVGFRTRRHYHELLLMERDGQYANVEELPRVARRPSPVTGLTEGIAPGRDGHDRQRLSDWMLQIGGNAVDFQEHGEVDLDIFVIRIIPKDYDLGRETAPQKYVVVAGNQAVILRAQRYEHQHDELPACVIELTPDRHAYTTPGVVEHLEDLQDALSWMYNCHDAETEILTERGFVRFPELAYTDRVATVDRETRQFWYEKPQQFYEYVSPGELVHVHSSRLDAMVTPNHKLWLTPARSGANKFAFVEASALDDEFRTWGSLRSRRPVFNEGAVLFPEKPPVRVRAERRRYSHVEAPWRWLAPFLGYYVSEGSATHGRKSGSYAVSIKQKKSAIVPRIDALMAQCPFHVTRYVDGRKQAVSWTITDRRFYRWVVEQCGQGANKRVPPLASQWSRTDLEAFMMAAMDGDGSWHRRCPGIGGYASTSRRLADGLQIIALELGWNASLTVDTAARRDRQPVFRLNLNLRGSDLWITPRNVARVPHQGKVYCVETSTHLIVTRRRGRILIGGQSHMENVRRTLNNQFVADPSVVEIADLLQPQPGLIARIRREYQGRPGALDNAIKQLPMTDVTRTHMQDMDLMINLMQRVAAAPENLQGILATSDRTLGEQQLALSAAAGRLRLEAQLAWIQGMNRVTHQRISNIQQYMQESRWIQIVGTYPRALGIPIDQKFLRVGPDEVQGQFTYELIDAMVRSDEAMLRALREVWLAVAQNPELQQRFDVVELFKPIAMMAGLKNIDEYTRASPEGMGVPQPGQAAGQLPPSPATPPGAPSPMPVVRPDEEVMRQVAAGNLVAA
jgi:hypothetical protein